jgi:large conductance mechanosensitive channel
MVQEFRDLIAKGNMIDIAVGFIMGAAFIALIGAVVDDILMPIVAIPFGQPSFDSIIWTVNDSQILIGSFITAIVAFLFVAAAVFFFIVKPYNAYRDRTGTGEEEDAGPDEVGPLTQVRDSLANRN